VVLTGSLSNEYRNRVITRQEAGPNSTEISRDESEFNTDNRMLANAMLGIGLEAGDHTFRLTNLFIRDTVKQASLASYNRVFEFPSFDFLEQNTAWYERQLIDSQVVAELDFGPLQVDLRGGFARTDREAPYNMTYVYGRDNGADDSVAWRRDYLVDLGRSIGSGFQETGVEVSFSDLYEELWYAGIDTSYDLTDRLTGTIGYAYSDTDRFSQRRAFLFDADVDADFYVTDPDTPPVDIPLDDLQTVLEIVGLRAPSLLLNSATYNLYDVRLIDQNNFDPAFAAELTVHAGYGQVQWVPVDSITIQGGVRYEDAEQATTPVGALNTADPVTKSKDDWLPALTVTLEAMPDLQLRASASRTIARPQFRELVRQRYFDPETNRQYSGNPLLSDSELLNFEARAEYYLGGQSRVSVAGFYKKIEDPIEVYVGLVTGDRFISYANAPSAQLYGGELDLQYNYDLYDIGGWFETKQLVLVGNYTYTKSDLSVAEGDTVTVVQGENIITADATNYFTDGAPLVGQSDHLVNLQLSLEDLDRLQQLSVLLSYASERVTLRGSNGLSDVIDKPGVQLDLVYRQGFDLFGTEAELKLEARNLLGTDHEEYQVNNTGLVLQNNSYDVGQSFGASLSVTF
jgi:outer membrane receptor protein involved in Fe transport